MVLQNTDKIQQEFYNGYYKGSAQVIKDIVKQIDSGSAVLITFYQDNWGGHAVTGYDTSHGSWTFAGKSYDSRIEICDPNQSTAYDEKYCIYYDSESYSWIIPIYSVGSQYGGYIDMGSGELDVINHCGYLDGAKSKNTADYITFLRAANSVAVSKAKKDADGTYDAVYSKDGEITPFTRYLIGYGNKGESGYLLRDSGSAYIVSSNSAGRIDTDVEYKDCTLSADVEKGNSVVFGPTGNIEVSGKDSAFDLKMVSNEGEYPTDWYAFEVSGSGANASLERTDGGYLIEGSDLSDLTVTAGKDAEELKGTFSTDEDAVLIYEKNDKIAAAADTDGNGTFETEIPVKNEKLGALKGDANGDGKLNVRDAAFIASKLAKGKQNELPENSDFNEDGKVNVRDAAAIAKFLAKK